jgi:prepilin-type N-terminal cleavage/methylation domain-containing protein
MQPLPSNCIDRRASHRRGFTLVEMVATIAVMAALGTVASTTVLSALNSYLSASTRAQLHTEISMAVDRIVRELQNTQLDTSVSGVAPDIESVSASTITWNDDYSLTMSGGQILFTENGAAAAPILNDATSFGVQTYDESNAALGASLSGSSCDSIRRVRITITMQRNGIAETLRVKVFLRCTMEGA